MNKFGPKIPPFRELELQLQLEKVEKEWELAKKKHDHDATAESMDEVLKIAVEKIKILTEMSLNTYRA